MSRSIFKIKYRNNFAESYKSVESILSRNKFSENVIPTGENVWRKGGGLAMRLYVKAEYGQNEMILYAWVEEFLGNCETDLTGIVGVVPKKKLLKIIEEIKKSA